MDFKRVKVSDPVLEVDEKGETKYAWTGYIGCDGLWDRLNNGDAKTRFLSEWHKTSNYNVRTGMLKALEVFLASTPESYSSLVDVDLVRELDGGLGHVSQIQTKGDR